VSTPAPGDDRACSRVIRIPLGQADVFVNVAGGVRIDERADLAIALPRLRRPSVPAPRAAAFAEIG